MGTNRFAHLFLSCKWHSIYNMIFHEQFLICWFVCFVTLYALRNPQLPIFSLPLLPIVQAVHWLTPNRSHADCYCVYLKLTAQNTLWANLCLSTHTLTIKLCYHTQIYKVWYLMFCISDQQKSQFQWKCPLSSFQTLITWWRVAVLVFNHKTASMLPPFNLCLSVCLICSNENSCSTPCFSPFI